MALATTLAARQVTSLATSSKQRKSLVASGPRRVFVNRFSSSNTQLAAWGNRHFAVKPSGRWAPKRSVTRASAEPQISSETAKQASSNSSGLGGLLDSFIGGSPRNGRPIKKNPLNGDGTSDWLTAEELELLNTRPGSTSRAPRTLDDREESDRKWRGNYGLFALLLFFIPLAVSTLARVLVIEPVMTWHGIHHTEAFAMSKHQKAAAYEEIVGEEKETQFDVILGKTTLAEQPVEAMKERAAHIEAKERARNQKALENLVSDMVFFATLTSLLVLNPSKVAAVRQRLSDKFYGMPAASQAFAMLLVADILVGYHSADGWITVVSLVSEHYGFGESEVFVHMFVATVPVTLDVIFKYWVFRFLRQSNPSTGIILEDIDRH